MLSFQDYYDIHGSRFHVLEEILVDRLDECTFDLAHRYLNAANAEKLTKNSYRLILEAVDDAHQIGLARLVSVDGEQIQPLPINELFNIMSAYGHQAALTAFRVYLIDEGKIDDDAPGGGPRCLHNIVLSELMDCLPKAKADFELYCEHSWEGQSWQKFKKARGIKVRGYYYTEAGEV